MESEISIPMKTPHASVSQPIVFHIAVHPPVGLPVRSGIAIVPPPRPMRDTHPARYHCYMLTPPRTRR